MDFILGDMNVAIEVKGSHRVHSAHTKALRALLEEHTVKQLIPPLRFCHGKSSLKCYGQENYGCEEVLNHGIVSINSLTSLRERADRDLILPIPNNVS